MNHDRPLGPICQMCSEVHDGTTMIHLSGEFDMACEHDFVAEISHVVDADTEALTLDLRGLEFMDSTGLRMLLWLENLMRKDGLDFTVLCGNGQVRRLLRDTGLDGVLPVVDPFGVVPRTDAPV